MAYLRKLLPEGDVHPGVQRVVADDLAVLRREHDASPATHARSSMSKISHPISELRLLNRNRSARR
jgi:hypothetical protein